MLCRPDKSFELDGLPTRPQIPFRDLGANKLKIQPQKFDMSYLKLSRILIGILVTIPLLLIGCNSQSQPQWPEITSENKPWTRWWWMGNAVNEKGLAQNLEKLEEANLGGVEITPIYGVAGYEDQFIDYLSPEWMEMLDYTLKKSDSLGLGVDMATGTGWPFGGPWINGEHASKRLYYRTFELTGGETLDEPITLTQEPYVRAVGNNVYELHGFLKAEGEEPQGTVENPLEKQGSEPLTIEDIEQPISANDNLQTLALEQVRFEEDLSLKTLMAYSDDGQTLNLTDQVQSDGILNWTAPEGQWNLYALFTGWHGKMVERAAPGGEGFVIDHFSEPALEHYLATFDTAFAGNDINNLRSFFNDSYEVDDAEGQANWTPSFFEEFEQRRGYDLRDHLPALLGNESSEMSSRVLSDYRETISDLLLEKFTKQWQTWADENQAMVRNQAHGSPANILDLYAASDIPETEGTDIFRAKMASSAANVTGKQLVSSESATWLNEHFQASLSEVKTAVDRYFISGINHIFYHGTAYSPEEDKWPGWLFYAAVHFQPTNPYWDHFKAFNQYVARTQSFLQSGKPDNDVLLYYPIHDRWAEPGYGLLEHFDGGIDEQFEGTAFLEAADMMNNQGYTFDFVSDRQLSNSEAIDGKIQTEGSVYGTIVVPAVNHMPLETVQKVLDMARSGNTILMYKGMPQDVPGMGNLDERQAQFKELINQLDFSETDGVQTAELGDGKIVLGDNLSGLFSDTGIRREPMIDEGLRFTRRATDDATVYFITNWGDSAVDSWVSIATEATSASVYDPMNKQTGYAKVRSNQSGQTEVYLQLEPGESRILKTNDSGSSEATYNYVEKAGDTIPVEGNWSVEFVKGGPELPDDIQTDSLTSWTDYEGSAYKNFSGTASYEIEFSMPEDSADGWLLDLGEVHQSANVSINGTDLGVEIGPVYQVYVPNSLLQDQNVLTVEVANLMANRIAYMEKNNIGYKKFYNVNFPARLGENRNERGLFDASDWEPQDSGLMGPVTLTPVMNMK